MTRKDYQLIANAIELVAKLHRNNYLHHSVVLEVAQSLADSFGIDNLEFNRAKFIAACFAYQQIP